MLFNPRGGSHDASLSPSANEAGSGSAWRCISPIKVPPEDFEFSHDLKWYLVVAASTSRYRIGRGGLV